MEIQAYELVTNLMKSRFSAKAMDAKNEIINLCKTMETSIPINKRPEQLVTVNWLRCNWSSSPPEISNTKWSKAASPTTRSLWCLALRGIWRWWSTTILCASTRLNTRAAASSMRPEGLRSWRNGTFPSACSILTSRRSISCLTAASNPTRGP